MAKLEKFFKAGSALAGEPTDLALSSFLPGHEAITSMLGSTAGSIVTDVINDIADRALSKQESARVSACAAVIIETIKNRIIAGDEIRDDDRFRMKVSERPKAEQIFEGVLLKSKSQYEQLKFKLLANLYSNACFDKSLSTSIISFYMQALDRITYEHIITLYVFVLIGDGAKWVDGDTSYFFQKK
jgi:hypothetical protein